MKVCDCVGDLARWVSCPDADQMTILNSNIALMPLFDILRVVIENPVAVRQPFREKAEVVSQPGFFKMAHSAIRCVIIEKFFFGIERDIGIFMVAAPRYSAAGGIIAALLRWMIELVTSPNLNADFKLRSFFIFI